MRRLRLRGGFWLALCAVLASPVAQAVNNCNSKDFTDLTAESSVDLTFTQLAYSTRCSRVNPGTMISFSGDFSSHPLRGGQIIDGTEVPDFGSPIPSVSVGTTTASFLIAPAGVYGFYCAYHGLFGESGVFDVGGEIVFSDSFD